MDKSKKSTCKADYPSCQKQTNKTQKDTYALQELQKCRLKPHSNTTTYPSTWLKLKRQRMLAVGENMSN